ncbi:MAG: hypothetical protein KAJ39_05730 [Gammaproteobacteria bacterium]|nr:hypothetical protein [Gammaproteobacteria bacterium]
MNNTEFEKEKENTQTKSSYYKDDKISLAINAINKTNFHRLVFAISVIGYIIIAFNGHMENWSSIIRYSSFILFSLFMCFVLLFIRKNRLSIENKIIKISTKILNYNYKNYFFVIFIFLVIVLLTQILKVS